MKIIKLFFPVLLALSFFRANSSEVIISPPYIQVGCQSESEGELSVQLKSAKLNKNSLEVIFHIVQCEKNPKLEWTFSPVNLFKGVTVPFFDYTTNSTKERFEVVERDQLENRIEVIATNLKNNETTFIKIQPSLNNEIVASFELENNKSQVELEIFLLSNTSTYVNGVKIKNSIGDVFWSPYLISIK